MAENPFKNPMVFVSDVHGNHAALEAIVNAVKDEGVSNFFIAGDLLLPTEGTHEEDPQAAWRILKQVQARCTTGPSDLALATVAPDSLQPTTEEEAKGLQRFQRARRVIGDLIAQELRNLPSKLRIPMISGEEILMVHASPDGTTELDHDLSDDELATLVSDDPAEVIVCGATHVPYVRQVEGQWVVNVGSVGAAPEGRNAHFTIITPRMDGPGIVQRWVAY